MWGHVMRGIVTGLALGCTLVAVGCGEPAANFGPGPASTTAPRGVEVVLDDRAPDDEQVRALRALAAPPRSAVAITASGGHEHGHGAPPSAPAASTPALERQLGSARTAASALAQKARLSRAGYYVGSYYSRGVGTHYIDWRRVGAPFDVARPAMLLVDTTPAHTRRLAGFSYWVRSDGPPAGFVGDGDVWHNHRGLCFVAAVLTRENVADPSDCEGEWVDGVDLWMLHAWVVPGYGNPDGVFDPTNRRLCPPRSGIDAGWC
jgi:hypothetical protein